MMHVVKAQEGCLRSVRALVAIRDPTPQHFGVETERAFEVRYQDSHMSDALQLDTHRSFPPSWSPSSHTMRGPPPRGSNRTTPPSRSNHQLQAVPIRVIEVDAAIFPRTTSNCHAIFLQLGFECFVCARLHVQRQMVEVVACG